MSDDATEELVRVLTETMAEAPTGTLFRIMDLILIELGTRDP